MLPEPEPVLPGPEPVLPEPEPGVVADLTEPVAAEVAAVTAEVAGEVAAAGAEPEPVVPGAFAAEVPEPELVAADVADAAGVAEVAACACRENTSRMVRIPAAKIATCTAR